MSEEAGPPPVKRDVAPLKNVAVCFGALQTALNRRNHLPGIVTIYGPSGWGKTVGALYASNCSRAYYTRVRSSWTKKALVSRILHEMGIEPERTVYDMSEQASEQLALSGRPLVLDEGDHLVERGLVELVRDIHDSSNAAILLIGEERLPQKLKRFQRFHSRVLQWHPAQPADFEDARQLRELYCDRVRVGDALLRRICEHAQGSVRRICVSLEHAREEALRRGLDRIDIDTWGKAEIFTGDAPRRRIA